MFGTFFIIKIYFQIDTANVLVLLILKSVRTDYFPSNTTRFSFFGESVPTDQF